MMKLLKNFTLSPMGVNCFLLDINGEIILIDAPSEIHVVINYLQNKNLVLSKVILTHFHFDHMLGLDELFITFPDLELYIDSFEAAYLFDPQYTLANLSGINKHTKHKVNDIKELNLDGLIVKTISGHSAFSSVLIFHAEKIVFTGDTLFKESIGRFDFPFGDQKQLINGIKDYLLTLDDDFIVYPGHGDYSTIEHEIRHNNFLK